MWVVGASTFLILVFAFASRFTFLEKVDLHLVLIISNCAVFR